MKIREGDQKLGYADVAGDVHGCQELEGISGTACPVSVLDEIPKHFFRLMSWDDSTSSLVCFAVSVLLVLCKERKCL